MLTSPQPTSRSPNPSQQRRNYGAFAARSPVWSAVAAAEAAAPKTRAWRYFILFFFIILVFQFFPCAVMAAAAAWSTEQFADPSHSPRHATRALAPVLILTHPLRQGWWRGTMLADRVNCFRLGFNSTVELSVILYDFPKNICRILNFRKI